MIDLEFKLYLQSINQQSCQWQWYTAWTIIYCRIYFLREVTRLTEQDTHSDSVHNRMLSLLNAQFKEDYFQICDLLIDNHFLINQLLITLSFWSQLIKCKILNQAEKDRYYCIWCECSLFKNFIRCFRSCLKSHQRCWINTS